MGIIQRCLIVIEISGFELILFSGDLSQIR